VGGGYALCVVERGVLRGGERGRAVVDIEEDGVKLLRVAAQDDGDIGDFDAHARVVQGIAGQRG